MQVNTSTNSTTGPSGHDSAAMGSPSRLRLRLEARAHSHALEAQRGESAAARLLAQSLSAKLDCAAALRETRLFEVRERGVAAVVHAQEVARRTKTAHKQRATAHLAVLSQRQCRAALKRAMQLEQRRRTAARSSRRVTLARYRRAALRGDMSEEELPSPCSSASSSGSATTARPSLHVHFFGDDSSLELGSPADSSGRSPARRRQRLNSAGEGKGVDSEEGSLSSAYSEDDGWFNKASTPRKSYSVRLMQRRLEQAAEKRHSHLSQVQQRSRRHGQCAMRRAQRHKVHESARLAIARHRMLADLEDAAGRREVMLAAKVKAAKLHSERVAAKVAQVKAAAVIKAALRGDHSGAAVTAAPDVHSPYEEVSRMLHSKTLRAMLRDISSLLAATSSTASPRHTFSKCSRALQGKRTVLAFRGVAAAAVKAVEEVLAGPATVSSKPAQQRCSKTLTASVIIARYPEEMFAADKLSQAGSEEQLLQASAGEVLACLEQLSQAVGMAACAEATRVTVAAIRSFYSAWGQYLDAFAAWKQRDGKVLADAMRPGFIQLELTRRMYVSQLEELEGDAEEEEGGEDVSLHATQQLLAGVGSHMAMMRRQLVNLVGQEGARAWEQQLLATLDEELKGKTLPSPPRLTFRRAAGSGKGSGEAASSHRMAASSTMRHRSDSEGSQPSTRTRSSGTAKMMRSLASNVELVHKLVLDPAYRMKSPEQPLCVTSEAAWSEGGTSCGCEDGSMTCARGWAARFSPMTPRDFATAVVAELRVIRRGLQELTPNRKDLIRDLKASIDLSFILDGMTAGTYGVEAFSKLLRFMCNHIGDMEAPARRETTSAWCKAATSSITARLEAGLPAPEVVKLLLSRALPFMHFKLAQISTDISNFQLTTLAPYLAQDGRGAAYERKRFNEALESGQLGLQHTHVWLASVVKHHKAACGEGCSHVGALRIDDAATRTATVLAGCMQLVSRPSSVVNHAVASQQAGAEVGEATCYPETLRLDAHSLSRVQNELQKYALTSAVMAMVGQVLGASAVAGSHSESESDAQGPATMVQLRAALVDWLEAEDVRLEGVVQGVMDSCQRICRAGMSSRQAEVLQRGVKRAIDTADPVFRTMYKRAVMTVHAEAAAKVGLRSSSSMNAAVSEAEEKSTRLARRSMEPHIKPLRELAGEIARIVQHNADAFSGHYKAALAKLAHEA